MLINCIIVGLGHVLVRIMCDLTEMCHMFNLSPDLDICGFDRHTRIARLIKKSVEFAMFDNTFVFVLGFEITVHVDLPMIHSFTH